MKIINLWNTPDATLLFYPYSNRWWLQDTVERMGRWIDFKRDYKTMYPWFMETVWWVFHQLFTKGLVYRGVKVMPFSTGCSTPLSNFEAGQNYKDVVDPAGKNEILLYNYVPRYCYCNPL